MTDRVGRHAAARDLAETLIIPAQQAWASDEPAAGPDALPQRSPRPAGRHASGRLADIAGSAGFGSAGGTEEMPAGRAMAMNGYGSPLNGHQNPANGHQSRANGHRGRQDDQRGAAAAPVQQQRSRGAFAEPGGE